MLLSLGDYFEITPVEREVLSVTNCAAGPQDDPIPVSYLSVRGCGRQILAPARCAQCGRTPLKHGVILNVDMRVPSAWGGATEAENLQPLCEECQDGKDQYLMTYSACAKQSVTLPRSMNRRKESESCSRHYVVNGFPVS